MAEDKAGSTGGIHLGNVRGGVEMKAGGDIVAGDKTTTVSQTTTIQKGFAGEGQKQEFQNQVERLRDALRELKTQIEAHAALSRDQKEEIVGVVLQQVRDLKEIKEQAASAPVGKPAPASLTTTVEKTLSQVGGVIDKVQDLAKKAQGIGQTVGEFAAKYGPLLAGVRQLFGLS